MDAENRASKYFKQVADSDRYKCQLKLLVLNSTIYLFYKTQSFNKVPIYQNILFSRDGMSLVGVDELKLKIIDFEVENNVVYYKIRVDFGKIYYVISRRFSEFYEFNQYWKSNLKNSNYFKETVLTKAVFSTLEPEFIEKRILELQRFLFSLAKIFNETFSEFHWFAYRKFTNFLELQKVELFSSLQHLSDSKFNSIEIHHAFFLTQLIRNEAPGVYFLAGGIQEIIASIVDKIKDDQRLCLTVSKDTNINDVLSISSIDLSIFNVAQIILEGVPLYFLKPLLPVELKSVIVKDVPDMIYPGQFLAAECFDISAGASPIDNSIYRSLMLRSNLYEFLEVLDLSNNHLQALDSSVLNLTPSLKYLDVSNNNISVVDSSCFLPSRCSLEVLNLSFNSQLSILPAFTINVNS